MLEPESRAQRKALKQTLKQNVGTRKVVAEVYGMRLVRDLGPVTSHALVTEDGLFAVTREVMATLDIVGEVTATRGRDLGDKAVGTALFGPLGLALMGNSKVTTNDQRTLLVLVEGPDWVQGKQLGGPHAADAQRFVHKVNAAAKEALPVRISPPVTSAPADAPPPEPASEPGFPPIGFDVIDAIERLGGLRDSGVVTEEEFQTKKAELLGRL